VFTGFLKYLDEEVARYTSDQLGVKLTKTYKGTVGVHRSSPGRALQARSFTGIRIIYLFPCLPGEKGVFNFYM